MSGEFMKIFSEKGDHINAYLALPNTTTAPGVTILSDPLHYGSWIKGVADEFSRHGYLVCVPELNYYDHGNTQANKTQLSGKKQIDYSFPNFHQDLATQKLTMEILENVFNKIKSHTYCNGKIATVGFSWGGTLGFLAASRLNPNALIVFSPKHIEYYLQEGKLIDCDTILHMGKLDYHITEKTSQKIHAALVGKFNIAIYLYEAGHGFADSQDLDNFCPEAKTLAFQRTFNLIDKLK